MTKTKTYTYVPEVKIARAIPGTMKTMVFHRGESPFGTDCVVTRILQDISCVYYAGVQGLCMTTEPGYYAELTDIQAAKDFLDEHLAAKPVKYTFTYDGPDDGFSEHVHVSNDPGDLGLAVYANSSDIHGFPYKVLAAAKKFLRECLDENDRDAFKRTVEDFMKRENEAAAELGRRMHEARTHATETYVHREEKMVKYEMYAPIWGRIQYRRNGVPIHVDAVPDHVRNTAMFCRQAGHSNGSYTYPETTETKYTFKYIPREDGTPCVVVKTSTNIPWYVYDGWVHTDTLPAPVLKAAREYLAWCEGKKNPSRVCNWQDVSLNIGGVDFCLCDIYLPGDISKVSVSGVVTVGRDYLKDRSWTK